MRWASPLLLLAAAGCATTAPQRAMPAGESFGPAAPRDVRTLVFVLDGAGDGAVPAQTSGAAHAIADAIAGARVIALPRPVHGDAIAAVADTMTAWRARYPQTRTILVGQSGGAATAAALTGVRPGLVDGVVLAGCPCMLPEWRKYRAKHAAGVLQMPAGSFDPLMTVGGISPTTRVALLVGADDAETPLRFSRGYAEALALRGIATDYRVLPGRGHDLLRDDDLIDAVRRIADAPAPTLQRSVMVTP